MGLFIYACFAALMYLEVQEGAVDFPPYRSRDIVSVVLPAQSLEHSLLHRVARHDAIEVQKRVGSGQAQSERAL